MLMLTKLIWSHSIQLIIPELHQLGTVLDTASMYICVLVCVCVYVHAFYSSILIIGGRYFVPKSIAY